MPVARPANFVIQMLFHTLPKNLGQDFDDSAMGHRLSAPA